MSKEIGDGTPTSALENKQDAVSKPTSTMTSNQAANLIMAPYVTEKTFNQIERENKLAFIVAEKATKKQIVEAILILYEAEIQEVNTTRTIRGKKAFVKFKAPEGARDLATKLALV
jgi:large subunit ribosomal protein L23